MRVLYLCDTAAVRLFRAERALRRASAADQSAGASRCRRRACSTTDADAERAVTTRSGDRRVFPRGRSPGTPTAPRSIGAVRAPRGGWRAPGGLCAVASALALALLMPLKRVDPFLVRVDNSTGIVDVVPVYAGARHAGGGGHPLFSHSLPERVRALQLRDRRERLRGVRCLSFGAAQSGWYALWTATNPASPLNVHKDGSTCPGAGQSVSFFTRSSGLSDLAQVRYLKAVRQGAGAEEIVHALDRDHPIRLRGTGEGSEDAPLESARASRSSIFVPNPKSGRTSGGRRSAP